ncbi:MAG TPA: MYG1 family protein [Solirubrobacteraceae bacterium]|nr:MYG1 family protein [Solirubrobacteraceae bacterium]
MKVATHDGSFHADDVFAVAALSLTADEPLEIVRTRDRAVLDACDVRVDVGLRDDPATADFDHHQKGGAGKRPNGIPYASFGLVWRAHGTALCGGDERAAGEVDARLVQGVDAIDTGVALTKPLIGSVRPMDLTDLVDQFNPSWDEETSPEDRLRRFHEAVAVAAGVLRRRIAAARSRSRAHTRVLEAIRAAEDPRVVILQEPLPWHEPVVTGAPEALYVVYPKTDGWGVQAVPQELGTFVNRKPLPESWAGLQAAELAAETGVEDAVFCHGARFLAVARSREGVMELVRQALAA